MSIGAPGAGDATEYRVDWHTQLFTMVLLDLMWLTKV